MIAGLGKWITGAMLVLGCYYLGSWLSSSMGVPLPSALTGLIILLAVLFIFPKAEPLVARAASPLLSHMSVLFVPAVLGVSAYWTEIAQNGWAIGIAIIIINSKHCYCQEKSWKSSIGKQSIIIKVCILNMTISLIFS